MGRLAIFCPNWGQQWIGKVVRIRRVHSLLSAMWLVWSAKLKLSKPHDQLEIWCTLKINRSFYLIIIIIIITTHIKLFYPHLMVGFVLFWTLGNPTCWCTPCTTFGVSCSSVSCFSVRTCNVWLSHFYHLHAQKSFDPYFMVKFRLRAVTWPMVVFVFITYIYFWPILHG